MTGIIITWTGTLITIPTGWSLCDGNDGRPNLLGKYLKSIGATEDPGSTGGSSTHTHTSPIHIHTQDVHGHSVTSAATGTGGGGSYDDSTAANDYHTHLITLANTEAVNQTTAVTLDTVANDPPYYKVAFIYDDAVNKYPVGSIILWNDVTPPLGWSVCDGTGDTPDLRDKFLKSVGAAENPGGTGGSVTHTHTNSVHNHTQDSHTHTGSHGVCSGVSVTGTSFVYCSRNHTHGVSVGSAVATNQVSSVTIQSDNGEPSYYKLLFIKNTGAQANRPKYGIVIWTGTIDNIPVGYVLCDGTNGTPDLRNYFIKGALDYTELGNIGGSIQHSHIADSHTHTQDSHSHTAVLGSGSFPGTSTAGNVGAPVTHGHASVTTTGVATNQGVVITVSDCDSEAAYPSYYEVAFIMQDRELDLVLGASLMQMLL